MRASGAAKFWFAMRLGVWLCWLPVLLRVRTVSVLLDRLTAARPQHNGSRSLEVDQTVRMVVQVCRLCFFCLPMFPRVCLRQSLALYYVLARQGYPVKIHFGVCKHGDGLHGHSWVTLYGRAVVEKAGPEVFKAVYSYPSEQTGKLEEGEALETWR